MQAIQATHSTFTPAVRCVIDHLCSDLSSRIHRNVTADYGQTDCGQFHDAALCIEGTPEKFSGVAGPPG